MDLVLFQCLHGGIRESPRGCTGGQAAMDRVRRADVAEREGGGGHDRAYRRPDGRTA